MLAQVDKIKSNVNLYSYLTAIEQVIILTHCDVKSIYRIKSLQATGRCCCEGSVIHGHAGIRDIAQAQ